MSAFRDRNPRVIGGILVGRGVDAHDGLVWGAFIVVAGVVLLLDQLGFISVNIWRFWPVVIIFLGISCLVSSLNASHSGRAFGAFLLLLGVLFQLNTLGIVHFHMRDLWPLFLIFIGLLLMWGALKKPSVQPASAEPTPVSSQDSPAGFPRASVSFDSSSVDTLNVAAVLGGVERSISTKHFKGGRVSTVLGGVELDFRDADMEGEQVTLEIDCIFGGVEIRVPPTWHVHSLTVPILGGFSDSTRLYNPPDSTAPPRKTLVITGTLILGGVEIKN